MRRTLRALLALTLAGTAAAADNGTWQDLASLRGGQRVEVRTASGDTKGEFVRFDDRTLTLHDKKGEHSIPQAEVKRVALGRSSRAIWIGAAIGGGGGVAAGAGLGSRLANESGGDFANLKGVIAVACGAAGALIGAAIGASARRTTVIYQR